MTFGLSGKRPKEQYTSAVVPKQLSLAQRRGGRGLQTWRAHDALG